MNTRTTLMLSALLALLLNALPLMAERSHTEGGYTVHYNAIPTTALDASVARGYGITRSGSRALLNIAVLRKTADDTETQAVSARVVAHVRNLTGQRNPIELRELRDQDAIYYIGEFRIRGEENLRFDLEVTPEGATGAIPVRFEHFFVGE